MARGNRPKRRLASSKPRAADLPIDFGSRGRAIRQCRKQPRESPFEDSAVAISDPDDDELDEFEVGDVISAVPVRKRKRSLSPELRPAVDQIAMFPRLESVDSVDLELADTPARTPVQSGHITLHLTVNIPVGHQSLITLQLDPSQLSHAGPSSTTQADRMVQTTLNRLYTRSKTKNTNYAGFLDLPAELRNEVYREIFVSDRAIEFSMPDNFSRSAALLRTCHQVHEEGRSILYSENRFVIERRTQRYGSLWENEWREIGYLNVRAFLKTIGLTNTALVRHLTIMLEDAVPCLNPNMRTNEERRFVHDDDLISVLRHLGDYAQLKTLKLHFHGRRRVERADDRFMDYMKRVKADDVEFLSWPPNSTFPRQSKQDEIVKAMLLKQCARKQKKFE